MREVTMGFVRNTSEFYYGSESYWQKGTPDGPKTFGGVRGRGNT